MIALIATCALAEEQEISTVDGCDVNFIKAGNVSFFKTSDSLDILEVFKEEQKWTA